MIMVMIRQITIDENRNKTARSISTSGIIRNAYLFVFSATRRDIYGRLLSFFLFTRV